MKKVFFIVTVILIITKCNTPSEHNIEREVFNYFIDSIIGANFSDYDLCGTFNSDEYTDSLLKLNLTSIDTFINRKDDEDLIRQYHSWQDKEITLLLNNPDRYEINKSKEYIIKDGQGIINHFTFSAPLITGDKDKAVLFFTGINLDKMVAEQYIYIFLNLKQDIDQWQIYVLETPYKMNSKYHHHYFSLIPPT